MDHFVKYGMLYSGALIEVENEEQTWGLYCIANQILTPSKYVRGQISNETFLLFYAPWLPQKTRRRRLLNEPYTKRKQLSHSRFSEIPGF